MAAITKEKLAELEARHGLKEDGLTYQQRLQRITRVEKGEGWEPPKTEVKSGQIPSSTRRLSPTEALKLHPLYGKKLLITPMMTIDKNRALYFDEPIGPDVEVEEVSAGKLLYGAGEEVDRMAADYKIIRSNPNKTVMAKTTLPKSGQEISFTIGKDLVPVVRGNDRQVGYVWSMAKHMRQYGDTMIQLYGLEMLISQIYPELLVKFKDKPMMFYVDGVVLAASIPLTDALLKEQRRKEIRDAKLGMG